MEIKWTYAKNLKAMPSKSGKYLFMTDLGTFFVGHWDTHERKLYTQCLCFDNKWDEHRSSEVRKTTGDVRMARWDWKTSGHVYWADIGELDYYKITTQVA